VDVGAGDLTLKQDERRKGAENNFHAPDGTTVPIGLRPRA
jgi:hypothetical protein